MTVAPSPPSPRASWPASSPSAGTARSRIRTWWCRPARTWRSRSRVSTDNDQWLLEWYFNFINSRGISFHQFDLPGVAASHALVLVNHGDASGSQLLALERNIADSVLARFGVAIEPEPKIIGASW